MKQIACFRVLRLNPKQKALANNPEQNPVGWLKLNMKT
jgi:hypothetical protein